MFKTISEFSPLLFILSILPVCRGQACTSKSIGYSNPYSLTNNLDSNTGYTYLLDNANYQADCCGVVTGWSFYVKRGGTIKFQVWDGSTNLVGENTVTIPDKLSTEAIFEEQHFFVPISPEEQINIASGYHIGWYTSGDDMITYNTDTMYTSKVDDSGTAASVGSGLAFGTTVTDKAYAIKYYVDSGTAPRFSNLASTVYYSKDTGSGTTLTVFTPVVTDDDNDNADLSISMTPTGTSFTYAADTVTIDTGSLTVGNTNLNFDVTDGCHTTTKTLSVSVQSVLPTISNMPAFYDIDEEETAQQTLLAISATHPTDTVTCSLTSTDPADGPFSVSVSGSDIQYNNNQNFIYATARHYEVKVSCSGADSNTAVGYLVVDIVKNSPPVVTNLPGSTKLASGTGGTLLTVVVADDDNDVATDMTYTCPQCSSNNGEIVANAASLTNVGADLFISVSDGKTTVGPYIFSVQYTSGFNSPPEFTNLDAYIDIPENTALGTTIYTVKYRDLNQDQALTPTMPTNTYFNSDPATGHVIVLQEYDYESGDPTSVTLSYSVSDGIASDSNKLEVTFKDVNEAPSFDSASYTCSATEGDAPAGFSCDPFTVTDPDAGDTQTFKVDCGIYSKYITIKTKVFAWDYDMDVGLPDTFACVLTVTDSGGLTATADVTFTITPLGNDNTPVFRLPTFHFFTSNDVEIGTLLGIASATDADNDNFGSTNGVLTYSLLDNTAGYFEVRTLGNIYSSRSLEDFSLGSYTSFRVVATDDGGLSATASVTIVFPQVANVTTTTTERPYKFIEDSYNMLWIVATSTVAFALLIVIIVIILMSSTVQDAVRRWKHKPKIPTYQPNRQERLRKRAEEEAEKKKEETRREEKLEKKRKQAEEVDRKRKQREEKTRKQREELEMRKRQRREREQVERQERIEAAKDLKKEDDEDMLKERERKHKKRLFRKLGSAGGAEDDRERRQNYAKEDSWDPRRNRNIEQGSGATVLDIDTKDKQPVAQWDAF